METGASEDVRRRRSEALGALLPAPGWLALSSSRLALTPSRSVVDVVLGILAALLLAFTIYSWWRTDQQARDVSVPAATPDREIVGRAWPTILFAFFCLAPVSSQGLTVVTVAVSAALLAVYVTLLVHVRRRSGQRSTPLRGR